MKALKNQQQNVELYTLFQNKNKYCNQDPTMRNKYKKLDLLKKKTRKITQTKNVKLQFINHITIIIRIIYINTDKLCMFQCSLGNGQITIKNTLIK